MAATAEGKGIGAVVEAAEVRGGEREGAREGEVLHASTYGATRWGLTTKCLELLMEVGGKVVKSDSLVVKWKRGREGGREIGREGGREIGRKGGRGSLRRASGLTSNTYFPCYPRQKRIRWSPWPYIPGARRLSAGGRAQWRKRRRWRDAKAVMKVATGEPSQREGKGQGSRQDRRPRPGMVG
jgi:hypothetical protein